MARLEDCSSVLEQFVHDVANLPAEISHLMEEIQAKDNTISEHRTLISSRDASLQKFIKQNGSLTPNPKEETYTKTVLENLDKSLALQDEKIALADRASALLDRQVKRLDVKIRDLVRAGVLGNEPPLPSLLVPKQMHTHVQNASASTDHTANALRTTSATTLPSDLSTLSTSSPNTLTPSQRLALQRTGSFPALLSNTLTTSTPHSNSHNTPRGSASSAPAAPAAAGIPAAMVTPGANAAALHLQRQREASISGSAAPDAKRRRMSSYVSGGTSGGFNAPAPRAGSTPGAAPARTTVVIKKNGAAGAGGEGVAAGAGKGANKKVAPHHQQLKKLKVGSGANKGGHNKHGHGGSGSLGSSSRSSGLMKVTSASTPAMGRNRSPNTTTTTATSTIPLPSDGDDSLLSSPNGSDVDALTATITASSPGIDDDGDLLDLDMEGVEEHVDGEDTKVYCTCRTVSHGDMVACDNEGCPYEWFHWKCVGLTREPTGMWYCEECRRRLGK